MYRLLTITLLSALLLACSNHPPADQGKMSVTSENHVTDAADRGSISGVVHFSGTPPQPQPINMSVDPACAGQNKGETVVANDGKLANVVVYIKAGLPQQYSVLRALTPKTLNQDGCRYVPHVLAVMVGDEVRITNSDATIHNIHPKPHENREWNLSQPPNGEPLSQRFTKPELMIPVTCNVHPWMKAYINVFANPFFAVTDSDGKFAIDGLPPGTYTLAAIHESLGEQTMQITVSPHGKAQVEFTYAGVLAAAGK